CFRRIRLLAVISPAINRCWSLRRFFKINGTEIALQDGQEVQIEPGSHRRFHREKHSPRRQGSSQQHTIPAEFLLAETEQQPEVPPFGLFVDRPIPFLATPTNRPSKRALAESPQYEYFCARNNSEGRRYSRATTQDRWMPNRRSIAAHRRQVDHAGRARSLRRPEKNHRVARRSPSD